MKSLRHAFFWNLVILLLAIGMNIAFGAVAIPARDLFRMLAGLLPGVAPDPSVPDTFRTILFGVRFPHMVLVCLTGAALSSSGAVYQGLFRNPLADPYLIGVASGAGLGAVTAMSLRWPSSLLGYYSLPVAAFLGASITVLLVYSIARVGRTVPTTNLILAGVAISSFATALSTFLMLRSNEELRRAMSWLVGGSLMAGWQPVLAVLPYLVVGMGVLVLSSHTLNVLQFGEEQAQQLGIPIERRKLLMIAAASLTAASAVAFAGVIGFIGLIVPHLMRLVWGSDYRRLVPLSILGGGSALLLADLLARTVLAPQVLPVGIVTALAGAPFFLWVLRRAKQQGQW